MLSLSFACPCQRSSCGQEAVSTEAQPCPSAMPWPLLWLEARTVSICTAVECNVDVMAPVLSCAPCGAQHSSPSPPGSLRSHSHVLHGSSVTISCSSEALHLL